MNPNTIPDGGAAFPSFHQSSMNGHPIVEMMGMTLRDYIAVKALHALLTEPPWHGGGQSSIVAYGDGYKGDPGPGKYAYTAYKFADAMIKAREAS